MDSNAIITDFSGLKNNIAALKAALRAYLYGFNAQEPHGLIFPFGEIKSSDAALQDEVSSAQASLNGLNHALSALLLSYKTAGNAGYETGLELFDLKADNLFLKLELLEIKLNAAAALRTLDGVKKRREHSEEEYRELATALNNLDFLYKEQSEDLLKSRESAKKILDYYFRQAPIGICVLRGPEFVVELANELYLQLVDRNEQFIGKPLFDSLYELRATPIEDMLGTVLRSGVPYVGNEVGVHLVRNGQPEPAFFNFVYQPLFEENGSVSGIAVVCTEVTEMVTVKNALLEKEKEFRNMVMQSPIAMCIFRGPDLVIEIANTTMLTKLWRKEFSEVEGRELLDVFPELKDQKYIDLLYGVMATGISHRESDSLAYVKSHDGTNAYYLDYEYAPLYDTTGAIYGVMCTVNDVSERVAARHDREQSQRRSAHLIETLPIAMYTIDANGYIDLYNQAAETLWGRRPLPGVDRWCGSYKLASLEGVPIPHDECPMALAFKQGKSIEEEIYMYRQNGDRRHVIVHPQALHDDQGNVIGATKVMIDITERVAAEEALRKSEQKFRVLSESIPQLIWTGNAEGVLHYFSDSVSRYTGIRPDDLLNGGWLGVVHPDDREENVARWEHSVQTGNDFIMEHRFRHYEGEYRWQLSRATAHRDEKGTIVEWVGTSTDIDDQKAFQHTLETLVEDRTHELKKANIDLQNMNKELSSFAYISSHDLQEPLRKIQTFGSIILENEHANLSDMGRKNFARMQHAAARMTKLIQDLLTYSRANATEKVFEAVNLQNLVREVAAEFSDALAEKSGTIHIGSLPVINGIPFQLRQLFSNLVSNAVKFAKADEPLVIEVASKKIKGSLIDSPNIFPEKNYFKVTVTDNGIGFSQEYATRIFEVFQRLHSKTEYEGTGIGLAICSKIAENHQAVINAVSQAGKGATFTVYFPV